MSALFEHMTIKKLELQNRFVRSATYDGCADKSGQVSERQIKLFSDLADGGIGLIVTGITYAHPSGQSLPFQNSLASDDFIPGFKRLTAAVHKRGGRIAVQLYHAGRERARFLETGDDQAMAPSVVKDDPYFPESHRSMTDDEIWEIINSFGDAARRAREAGFDAVQIHGAHGFLMSQFLSPFTNFRDDIWGGTPEHRLRFHLETYKDIREKVGEDYPVLIKIGVQDGFSGGLEFREGMEAARLLAKLGFDALEISQGLRGKPFEGTEFRTEIGSLEDEAYFGGWCRETKETVNVPVMMVGGLRTFELMEEVVQKNETDFVSLCRPFIREPGIINSWKSMNRGKAKCISCNGCLLALRKGEPLRCVQEEEKDGL